MPSPGFRRHRFQQLGPIAGADDGDVVIEVVVRVVNGAAAGPALLWRCFLKQYLAVASLLLFLICLAALTLATPLIEAALGVNGELANIFNAKQPARPDHVLGTNELGRNEEDDSRREEKRILFTIPNRDPGQARA